MLNVHVNYTMNKLIIQHTVPKYLAEILPKKHNV